MLKQKILKLAKRLNKFTYDDLLILSEEENIQSILDTLIQEGFVNQISDCKYLFIDQNITLKKRNKNISKTDYPLSKQSNEVVPDKNLFYKESELQIFKELPESSRKNVLKYLTVFKAAGKLRGNALRAFLKEWIIEYPEYKVCYSTFMRMKQKYIKGGIKDLLPALPKRNIKSVVSDELYSRFKELYLSPNKLSTPACINIIKDEIKEKHPEKNCPYIPSRKSFLRKLNLEFKDDEIAFLRNQILNFPFAESSEIEVNKQENPNKVSGNFAEIAKKYLISENFQSQKISTKVCRENQLKNHLIPFFGTLSLTDITSEKIEEFKKIKIEEYLSMSSINTILDILKTILMQYSKNAELPKSSIPSCNYAHILDKTEIKKLLNISKNYYLDFYPVLILALSTGITSGELLALKWNNVDFENKKIVINERLYNNKLHKYRNSYQKREINICDKLSKILKEWHNECPKGKFVFSNETGDHQSPEFLATKLNLVTEKAKIHDIKFIGLRDTCASIMIRKNLQINIIKEQLGFNSIQEIMDRYKDIFNSVIPKEINIIDEILGI